MPTAPRQLTSVALQNETDDGRFGRGQKLVRHVRDLEVADTKATARVGDRNTYPVTLDWSRPAPRGTCMCVDYLEGSFCKHIVALGLAVLGSQASSPVPATDPVTELLESLDKDALVALMIELTEQNPAVRDLLQTRAVAAGRTDAVDAEELVREVNEALRSRAFVDYRASFGLARDAEAVLDQLEALLDAGAADAVAKALLRATTRLRAITLRADDSTGLISGAGQRAVELYARACVEGPPNAAGLARWLVKFRRDSPGWPNTPLELFAAAFDAKALAIYRRGIEQWSDAMAGQDWSARFAVQEALIELADHDHDLDRAITLLSADSEHPAYAEIIRRLSEAGRTGEAIEWLDRAIEVRGISRTSNRHWVHPQEASYLYQTHGRIDDALAVWQRAYAQGPSPASWRDLLEFAQEIGRYDEIRAWAIATAEEQARARFGSGAALITIYLAEDLLDEAWSAADRFGPGHAWRELARVSGADRSASAAELFRGPIEAKLVHPDTSAYREIATLLVEMRDVSSNAEDLDAFADYVADIRRRFERRPSLLKALAAKRL